MKYNKGEISDDMTPGENITKFRKQKRMTQGCLQILWELHLLQSVNRKEEWQLQI